MFADCSLLQSLPDLSKWDTKNVKDKSYMFADCSLLQSLPDISKWNTKNVKDMSYSVVYYSLYQIFQNGILKMLRI